MPENKKESTGATNNIALIEEFKSSKMKELSSNLSSLKSKTAVLSQQIKTKRAKLLAIMEEEKARLEAELAAKEQLEAQKSEEEPKSDAESVKTEEQASQPETEAPAPEVVETPEPAPLTKDTEPAPEKPQPKAEKKPKSEKKIKENALAPKTEFEKVVVQENGDIRRIYVPPVNNPKPKQNSSSGYIYKAVNSGRTNAATQQGRPQQGQPRRPMSTSALNAPPAMPNKNQQKGKNNKTASQGNSNRFDDHTKNKRTLLKKGFITEDDRVVYDENGEEVTRNRYRQANKNRSSGGGNAIVIESAVITTDPVSIKILSEKLGKTAAEIVKQLFVIGEMKTINDSVDFATAELVASEFGITLEYKPDVTFEETLSQQLEVDEADENLVERPPVVTIMGHVDHGKTSLLDYIRKSNVTGGEAGGITQHIGAYTITLNGSPITFLDTPGHEAFTSMRARGAQVTDIAILVVAADDGIMPQTIEAINHAKQADVPIIVALNKMDKPGANPDRVLQQLPEYGITPEEWGGETPVVRVSAKTGLGVEELLEQILVRAEFEQLRANPNRSARGTIIEAKLDKGLGKIATILVQTGTLKVGDNVVAGTCTGKIRAMIDDKGRKVKTAGPSTPVSVTGWDDVPEAGDRIDVVTDEKFARDLAEERKLKLAASVNETTSVSLNDLFDRISKGELKSVKLIIKADVQGSVEAVKQSLAKLGNEEVSIDIIHSAVGGIKESDVLLAETAGAIIIGFNVRPDTNAKALAAQKKIDIRFYNIIYNAIEDVEKAVKGLLAPKFRENVLGSAEIRELFKISGVGTIAGCHVVDGKITRTAKARLIRNGKVEYDGSIASLRHGKEDIKEIARNFDCGIMLASYQDVKVGDIIEAYVMEQINEDQD